MREPDPVVAVVEVEEKLGGDYVTLIFMNSCLLESRVAKKTPAESPISNADGFKFRRRY